MFVNLTQEMTDMGRAKRKPESHIIDERAQRAIKELLPDYWTVRDYKPDYGIDFAVEIFEANNVSSYDTLGEHLFIQLKGTQSATIQKLKLQSRLNVEKYPLPSTRPMNHDLTEIDVIPFQLETSELVTVQRMGASLPVLLIVIDTNSKRAFFLCLNDYIDKVLLPEDPEYAQKGTKTIHIPIRNEITREATSLIPLSFYAKRAKLYAAFQKFRYQQHELRYTSNQELEARTKYFAQILLRYDFWSSCRWWFPIYEAHRHLQDLLNTGSPGLMKWNHDQVPEEFREQTWTDGFSDGEEYSFEEIHRLQEVRILWDQLANLGSIYEEICREWFLPTHLGILSS